jgi:hypothetical protein
VIALIAIQKLSSLALWTRAGQVGPLSFFALALQKREI